MHLASRTRGLPRPPFHQYPAAFPGPFPFPARGVTLPTVPVPDSQPPGVTPVGPVGISTLSASGHHFRGTPGLQAELVSTSDGRKYYYNNATRQATIESMNALHGQNWHRVKHDIILETKPVSTYMQQLLKRKLNQPTKVIECIKGQPTTEEISPGPLACVENASGGGKSQDKSSTFDQGFFVMPKSRRGLLDEYTTSVSARKGRGVVNIKLPHQGSACGMSYEVREVDIKEFLCICSSKIKVDQVGLLEDVSSSVYAKTVQLLQDLKSDGEIVQTSDPYAPVLPATASGRDSTSPQVEPFQYPSQL
ncbi:hypothetical protein KIW84_013349 [Lathyrus oleraceus]|uniref:Uncharacterized protein n=1 Tax=Pisum sativum TaxID=3888 RepID=A0A9D5BK71_PEA|nr:hypothetical protein KIW84_013349 [Pisum sativum]